MNEYRVISGQSFCNRRTDNVAFFENIWLLIFPLAWLQLRMFVNSSANVKNKTNMAKHFRSSNEK